MDEEINKYFSEIGRKGGKASWKGLTKKQRSERARKNASKLKTKAN